MRKRSIVLLAGAVAIAATLVVGPTATASSDRASAGTVVFIHDQEPPNLQGPWVGNNLYATSLVLNNIWYGGQIRDNKANLVPRLFTCEAEAREEEAADDCRRVHEEGQLVGRQARHREGPSRDVAGLHQPGEQRHQPDGLGGREVDHG